VNRATSRNASRPTRRPLSAAMLAVAALALTGCATTDAVTPRAIATPSVRPAGAGSVRTSASPPDPTNCTASYPPPATMPTPGQMPIGSWMAHIEARGYLIAGVAQTTYLWSFRNPGTAQLEGFDIDMVEQVNRAIFGPNPPPVVYKIIPNADRSEAVATGQVDLVAETMTINCARQTKSASDPYPVDFSTVYYNAAEQLLVPANSAITGPADLHHSRVCAIGGADSFGNLVAVPGAEHIVAWSAENFADCLLMLQQGQVDAIATDNAILYGLQAQDPNTRIVGPEFSPEPYGMAISKAHPEFTSFVNGVLAAERADGTWVSLYDKDLLPTTKVPETPPAATYKAGP
jgi:polar amino acid transport system substrate-binding protein